MIGIYKITNIINNKCYIGQSVNINRRIADHKRTAFDCWNKRYDYPLYRAFRKYGIENFIFEVIEECHKDELNDKERYYIEKFNSFFNGYNQTLGGDSSANHNMKEVVIGIIHDLETTNMYHKEIAAKWGISSEIVQGINTGRYWKHNREYPIQPTYNYLLRQNKHLPHTNDCFCCDCGKLISRGSIRCKNCNNEWKKLNHSMLVSREELKALIRSTPFTKIGELYNVTDNAVRKWCKKYNLPSRKLDINKLSDEEWSLI